MHMLTMLSSNPRVMFGHGLLVNIEENLPSHGTPQVLLH